MRYNKKEEIGKLRERIIVQSVTRSVTTSGFGTETWRQDNSIKPGEGYLSK